MKMRAAGGLAAAAMILAGVGAIAPSAGAAEEGAAAALTCRLGDACIVNSSGTVVYRNPNDAQPMVTVPAGGYVWNHGAAQPGWDHIQLYTLTADGSIWTVCLHYGSTATYYQPDPTAGYLSPGEKVLEWDWRSECVGDDDVWYRLLHG